MKFSTPLYVYSAFGYSRQGAGRINIFDKLAVNYLQTIKLAFLVRYLRLLT